MRRPILLLLAALLTAGILVTAQSAPPQSPPPPAPANGTKADVPPVLSEIDRLKIQNALQGIELLTLKIQAAAVELQKARADAEKLISAVTVPGWQLNDRLEFVRVPKEK